MHTHHGFGALLKGNLEGKHLIHDDAERVDVTGCAHVALTKQLQHKKGSKQPVAQQREISQQTSILLMACPAHSLLVSRYASPTASKSSPFIHHRTASLLSHACPARCGYDCAHVAYDTPTYSKPPPLPPKRPGNGRLPVVKLPSIFPNGTAPSIAHIPSHHT